MSTDMARVMRDGADGPRGLSMRARVALFAVALAAMTLPACQQDATLDPFVGPSELGLSLTLSASPDVLTLDGASQSLVTILARDGSGQVVANVTLRLQIRFGGTLQDFGQLSARTLVTGQDGQALATYTAPLGGSVDTESVVEILVTPVGDNYASAVTRSLTIRLVPPGIVVAPQSFTAGFRFTPSSPTEFQEVLFETNCLSSTDTNCVTDPNGQIVSYAWDFGDGSTASGATATHAYASQSTFTAVLTVTDALGRQASAARSVTVGSGGTPTASFAFSPTAPKIGNTIFFNASASTAPAGRSLVSYDWSFGDGATASGVTVSHYYDHAATFSVTLTVTDNRGTSASSTSPVIVTSSPPSASFVFSPAAPTTTTAVQFNAGESTPSSGRTITAYAWNFGDGSTATGVTASHIFTAGTYEVVLTVTDSDGETGTTTESVTVTAASGSGSPTASFTASPSPTPLMVTTILDATQSTPSDGATITSYMWNFGDSTTVITCPVPAGGPAECGPTPPLASHVYTTAASYTITLTVTDSLGQTDTETVALTVSP